LDITISINLLLKDERKRESERRERKCGGISSKYYIKIQFVPHREHITVPLLNPAG
jgi:hypothetical protein